ncbi:hypothetical protein [Streptomyces sp. NPDC054854]
MSVPTNGPKPTRWTLAQPGYGTPFPELLARAERGLARFLGDEGGQRESATDWGEASRRQRTSTSDMSNIRCWAAASATSRPAPRAN